LRSLILQPRLLSIEVGLVDERSHEEAFTTRSPDPPLQWTLRESQDHPTASGLGVLHIGAVTL
jgi:hypothetical protein